MAAPKEGGFKMSLGKLKVKPGLKNPLLHKDAKKPRLALGDDEPEDTNKQQEIVGWDAAEGGALEVGGRKKEEGLRIIPAQPNRDWRAEARRKILAKAPHQQEQDQKSMTEATEAKEKEEAKIQYGLTIIKKDEAQESKAAEASEPMEVEPPKDTLTEEQRLEKKALDALLTGKTTDEDLVIPVQSEEEAFRDDIHNAPEAPTLEAYEAQPIDGFGAALLRGMGWKDGEAFGKNGKTTKQKEVKRRPALLGIGAKEEAAVGVELGAWGPKSGKGKKVAQSYNPVALRNKRTGEIITEEELKAKLESQDMVTEEKPSKSRGKYSGDNDNNENDEHRRDKRREKQDDRNRDRRRDADYDSERNKDKERYSDHRREKEDYNDSDRRRDKRRNRDDEYDSERRKDRRRERSRSPDERSEKRRDRYRSRSRDAEDRRDRRKERDRRKRSRSRDSDDRRKRRREREYDDDERVERKRRH
ncbi:hypothetical protein T440DRAFT_496061 [Plenodomus tracheiphilus IPT5]|uniref:Pre-mRNA-splicing factor n=1 Tax=Plenodomus tracheiphilus IPT5 TaxID=1408161 RepID=A0A6A7BKM3_9PLEO|nr:hypothetical protein T440DRAFT_496061 [Plenodomus tracheiphilus IPT5]